jgi:hypothetical protein
MRTLLILIVLMGIFTPGICNESTLQLSDKTLMHEMRTTPYPLDKALMADRFVSFQWPLFADLHPSEHSSGKTDKSTFVYQLRYSQDKNFSKGVTTVQTRWPFYNPPTPLSAGVWYWQFGYTIGGKTQWESVQQVTVSDNPGKFAPPSLAEVLKKLSNNHPRILVTKNEWSSFMQQAATKEEYKWYLDFADKVLQTPMKSVNDIKSHLADGLDNEMKRKAMLTRESRRIIDAEEKNVEALIRSYLLTKNKKYADEALNRVLTMADWDKSSSVLGDFNDATLLSLCSMAYDSFYGLLTAKQKKELLEAISAKATSMYDLYNNHLENHIADNHVWQMTLRILTMAAFSVYGDVPEAATWVDYCYNIWLARFPGLNSDGGWHNGDSYFTVNTRTLIEVPYFYSRITGYDYFSDPWYQGNIMYTIFQQPPFSKSGGNGSGHQGVLLPNSIRVSYLDALARLTGNTYAADFVRRTLKTQPGYLKKALLAKPGDLAWFRLQCNKALPEGPGLSELPNGYVFPQTGLASFQTNWNRIGSNAMVSFRSSPYGSTSHALANQNAFNTFYGGKQIFYSSGHHIAFTDPHSMYCHRGTRGHNTILVNGMGQRIGTEGYGWIPRHYVGKKIGYVLGDASNAYGKVISPLWIERAKEANVQLTPETGWDENQLKVFRRHLVNLGTTGLTFIYDELEAKKPVTFTYMLHTTLKPMEVKQADDRVEVQGTNGENGISTAYIYSSGKLTTEKTDTFFHPAINWLRADDQGQFESYPNHWHFSASSQKSAVYRFATLIHTHSANQTKVIPELLSDGTIKIPGWTIKVNISSEGAPSFHINSTTSDEVVSISYTGKGATVINEDGVKKVLVDQFPELEI